MQKCKVDLSDGLGNKHSRKHALIYLGDRVDNTP